MAEIKSTLDLVMERTRHLTMTEEEKREQALSEFRSGVIRQLQRYLEGEMDLGRLDRELQAIPGSESMNMRKVLAGEAAKRIDPAGENGPLLLLLQKLCSLDTAALDAILGKCRQEMGSRQDDRIRALAISLEKRGVSGSAVVPNLGADPDWILERELLRKSCVEKLSDAAARL